MREPQTLFAAMIFATALSRMLLSCACFVSRYTPALAMWAICYFLASIGATLLITDGYVGDFWSIKVANALLAAAFGFMWKGSRRLNNLATAPPFVLTGIAVWLFACQIESIYASAHVRSVLILSIILGYTVLSGIELWRTSEHQLTLRWLMISSLSAYAGIYIVRVLWPGQLLFLSFPHDSVLSDTLPISFEVLFHTYCAAVLLAFMAKTCTDYDSHWSSMIDPMTGILNRQGFIDCGCRLMRLVLITGRSATLVEFDLKWAKSVVHGYGHPTEDAILHRFCEVVSESLRPGDLFGRIGRKQFACLLVNVPHTEALIFSEDIKRRVESMEVGDSPSRLHATVTTGLAIAKGRNSDLSILMWETDQVLHPMSMPAFQLRS